MAETIKIDISGEVHREEEEFEIEPGKMENILAKIKSHASPAEVQNLIAIEIADCLAESAKHLDDPLYEPTMRNTASYIRGLRGLSRQIEALRMTERTNRFKPLFNE
jgi:uncharacterized protein (UPF0548 family)